jgi:hypothetical protein
LAGLGDDPGVCIWYLRWTPWAITHGQDPLVTHRMLAPDGANLMWNTSFVLPSLVLWPITAIAGPLWSWNVLTTLAPVLSGWVAYLALRRHTSWLGALAGGVLYGFSPAMVAQSRGHPMVTVAILPPLAMLLLEQIITAESRRRRLLAGAGLGAAAAAQLLIGTELLAITVVGAIAGLAVLAALFPAQARVRARAVAEGIASAAAVGLVLGAFPLAIVLAGPQRVEGALQTPDVYVQDLAALVIPGQFQAVAPDAAVAAAGQWTGNAVEVSGYVDLPLLAVVAVAAVALWRRRWEVRWALLTATLLIVLSLGPHLHVSGHVLHVPLPWRAVGGRWLLAGLLPARMMLVAYLPLALILAIGIDAVRSSRRLAVRAAAGVAASIVVLSLVPKPIEAQAIDVPAFFTGSAVERIGDGALVVLSPQADGRSAMLDQALGGMRFSMIGGGAFIPGPRFGPPPSPLNDELAAAEAAGGWILPGPDRLSQVRDNLRSLGVDAVVVAPQPQAARVVELMTAVLGRPPAEVDGVALWMGVNRASLTG